MPIIAQDDKKDIQDKKALDSLTYRERQILELIACGKTNAAIAQLFAISPRTVEKHRANLMTKLDLHNLSDLVKFSIDHKLI